MTPPYAPAGNSCRYLSTSARVGRDVQLGIALTVCFSFKYAAKVKCILRAELASFLASNTALS